MTTRERAAFEARAASPKAATAQPVLETQPPQPTSVEQERIAAGLLPDGSQPGPTPTMAAASDPAGTEVKEEAEAAQNEGGNEPEQNGEGNA